MKTKLILFAVCALALAAPTFAHEGDSCPATAKAAATKTATVKGGKTLALKLSGLHCAECAMSVQSRLTKVAGVAGATVDAAKQSAVVTLKKGAKRPTDAALKNAAKSAGYVCVAVK